MTKASTHNLSDAQRKTAPKSAAGKARLTNGKTAPKVAVGEPRSDVAPRRARKVAAGTSDVAPKPAPHAEKAVDRQFSVQVPSSMQALAERNVTQAREVYERSRNTLHALLESLEKSCEGTVALNRKIIDIADHNVTASFDLAMSLAGAKNLPEVMSLQADYWRKQFANLSAQTEELRTLATKVAISVAEPIKARMTHSMDA
jgi:phasin